MRVGRPAAGSRLNSALEAGFPVAAGRSLVYVGCALITGCSLEGGCTSERSLDFVAWNTARLGDLGGSPTR